MQDRQSASSTRVLAALIGLVCACGSPDGVDDGPHTDDTGSGGDGGVTDALDADGDGYPEGEDCDDTDAGVHPGAEEVCADGVDQDCDGVEAGCTGDLLAWDGGGVLKGVEEVVQGVGSQVVALGGWSALGPRVAVGAPWTGSGDYLVEGSVLVIDPVTLQGPAFADDSTLARIEQTEVEKNLGFALDAMDVDGDGVDDLLVGEPSTNFEGLGDGAAWIIRGPIEGEIPVHDSDGIYILGPEGLNRRAGAGVSFLTGTTGEGSSGIAMGWTGGCLEDYEGGIYLVDESRWKSRAIDPLDVELRGEGPCMKNLGQVSAGDLNGDGIDDVVTGAQDAGGTWQDREALAYRVGPGIAYVVYGPVTSSMDLEDADGRLHGVHDEAELGAFFDTTADLDGDGLPELLVGAPDQATTEPDGGAAYVVPGPSAAHHGLVTDVASVTFAGDDDGLHLGWSMSADGDLDGDGHVDPLVGGSQGGGRVFAFRGPVEGTLAPSDAAFSVRGAHDGDNFGNFYGWRSAILTGVDFDGDGCDDWLAHADLVDEGYIGAVYLFYGGVWE